MLATKVLTPFTHAHLGIQISTWSLWGMEEQSFPGRRPSTKPSQLQQLCMGRGLPASWLACPSQHVELILLFPSVLLNTEEASKEPAGLLCRWLPAILSHFPRTISLYGISIRCAWQAASAPSQLRGFSMLAFVNYLCAGSWE